MPEIVTGVSFDTVAREWRCKWSADNDKASLAALQVLLNEVKVELKAVAGVKSVQRVVCGTCSDFKIIISLDAAAFGEWEKAEFAPEKAFLEKVKAVEGVSLIETQTYTLMPVTVEEV